MSHWERERGKKCEISQIKITAVCWREQWKLYRFGEKKIRLGEIGVEWEKIGIREREERRGEGWW